jgi:hypothetical protein
MENKFLKKWPSYKSWFWRGSFWLLIIGGIFNYSLQIRLNFSHPIQMEQVWKALIWMLGMLAFDYLFYRNQKKHALKQKEEKK